MQVSARTDSYYHSKLPIDPDEKILAVYKHHWFAYASLWFFGVILVIITMALALAFTSVGGSDGATSQSQMVVLAGAFIFSTLAILGTAIPVYLRSQEAVVLTEEAMVQVLQPSLFASKVSQLSLQHIADVSVRQDFFGSIFGFGHITVETPGEQNNYQFAMLPDPHNSAREIIAAHENFDAALESGRIATTLDKAMPQAPNIDPQQYQQFLHYQHMIEQQKGQQAAQANDPTNTPKVPSQKR